MLNGIVQRLLTGSQGFAEKVGGEKAASTLGPFRQRRRRAPFGREAQLNVAQLLRSLLVHRVALAMVAILAVLAGVAGWMSVSPVYRSTTLGVVIPPGGGDPDAMHNPLINLTFEVSQLALVVGTALQSEGGKQAAVDAGGTGEFTVEATFGTSSSFEQLTPQLNISADASSPESARRSAQALAEYAGGILNKMQLDAGVPVENDARLVWAVAPQAGERVPAGRTRRAGAYAVGTILAGVVLITLFDALLERRRGGPNTGRRQTGSDDDDGTAPKAADVGGAADRHLLTPRTVGPHVSKRSRHRYSPEADTDPDAITAANAAMNSPPTRARPDPS